MQVRNILNDIKNLPIEDLALTQLFLKYITQEKNHHKNLIKIAKQGLQALPVNISSIIINIGRNEIEMVEEIKKKFLKCNKNIMDLGKDEIMNEMALRIPDDCTLLTYEISAKVHILQEYFQAYFGENDTVVREVIEPLKNLEDSILAKRLLLSGVLQEQQEINNEVNQYVQEQKKSLGYFDLEKQLNDINNEIKKIDKNIDESTCYLDEKINLINKRNDCFLKIAEIERIIDIQNIYKNAQKRKNEIDRFDIEKESFVRKNMEDKIKHAQVTERIKILQQACLSYQNYLAAVIRKELENLNPKFATNVMVYFPIGLSLSKDSRPKIILRSGLDIAAEQAYQTVNNNENPPHRSMELKFGDQHQIINEPCKLALLKYHAINQLKNALNDEKKIPSERLEEFEKIFNKNENVITKRRDSQTIYFLKIVASIFTLGIAAPFFWIWHQPKGVTFFQNVKETLLGKNLIAAKKNNVEKSTAIKFVNH